MKPPAHIIVSLSLGGMIWFFSKSLYGAIICFVSGTAIDIDHILDYAVRYGWNFNLPKQLLRACIREEKSCIKRENFKGKAELRKVYFIFHSIEIALILWILSWQTNNIYILSGALGYSVHLILDYIGNQGDFKFYFIAWRIAKGFKSELLLPEKIDNKI